MPSTCFEELEKTLEEGTLCLSIKGWKGGTSLVVQWLRLHAPNAGGQDLIPGEGNGNPFQHSCLEKSHGRRSLLGYSPWGHKELDTTEQLNFLETRFHMLQLKTLQLRPGTAK